MYICINQNKIINIKKRNTMKITENDIIKLVVVVIAIVILMSLSEQAERAWYFNPTDENYAIIESYALVAAPVSLYGVWLFIKVLIKGGLR